VVTVILPCELVDVIVVTVGSGEMSGRDVTIVTFGPKIALYVLVARADVTSPPVEAWIDVLNAYVGVENEGVERRELGKTVVTVSDIDAK